MVGADIGLLGEGGPVSIAGTMEGKNEVVNRFGFGRDLTQRDPDTLERSSRVVLTPPVSVLPWPSSTNTFPGKNKPANVVSIFPQCGILELVKVRFDFQPDHRRRRVCQIMLLDFLIHCGYWTRSSWC